VGAVTAVGVVLASLVFSAGVGGLVSEPARYGWPYDAAVMVGFGYGGANEDAIARSLDRPEVEEWAIANLNPVTIQGEALPAVADRVGLDRIPLPVVDGRLPHGPNEIALGSQSAERLGIDVGDEITVTSYFGEREATVTGTVVLPPLGPFESDRAFTGTGALLSAPFFDEMVASAEETAGVPPGSLAETGLGAFVGITLRDGVTPAEFIDSIERDELLSWDLNRFAPLLYREPVRPAVIADVAGMRRVPLALGGLFALAMGGGLAVSIAVATRARRGELALLRALGGTRGQTAASVRWHACTVLAIGVPLGLAAGLVLYRAFARDLGVVVTTEITVVGMLAVAAGAVLVAMVAAALPARRAVRESVATVLREE
jgi:putative ABC transport system permease protein